MLDDVSERMRLLEMEAKLPYIHNMWGFNYRMTEMQSAIGLAELDRMDTWNMPRRRRNGPGNRAPADKETEHHDWQED